MRQAPDSAASSPLPAGTDWTFSPDPALEAALHATKLRYPSLFPVDTGRMLRFLERVGHPQKRLPHVFHVAGTNGKGSTLAFLQAILEAAGMTVHKYIGPHLVRFEERVVLNGHDIDPDVLRELIEEGNRLADGSDATYFEFHTALAFLAFSRRPADAVLVETGVGGLNDATNVFEADVTPVLTRISFDHMHILGDTLEKIAAHKAGILKKRCPAAAAPQPDASVTKVYRDTASSLGVVLHDNWTAAPGGAGYIYQGDNRFDLPLPGLRGLHQVTNAGTAIAALEVSPFARVLKQDVLENAMRRVTWPGRMQKITEGPLSRLTPAGAELWLDGAHNDSGAEVLLPEIRKWKAEGPLHVITAFKKNKDAGAFFSRIIPYADSVTVLGECVGSQMMQASELCDGIRALGHPDVKTSENLESALQSLAFSFPVPGRILIAGSLYLVGHALKRNS